MRRSPHFRIDWSSVAEKRPELLEYVDPDNLTGLRDVEGGTPAPAAPDAPASPPGGN